MPTNLKNAERCKLAAPHRAQIEAGSHTGRVDSRTSLSEQYLVTDILTDPNESEDVQLEEDEFQPQVFSFRNAMSASNFQTSVS